VTVVSISSPIAAPAPSTFYTVPFISISIGSPLSASSPSTVTYKVPVSKLTPPTSSIE